jgi:ATP synthase protein I
MADEPDPFRQGLSLAMRIGMELVVSTVVGALLGYLLDSWLGTRPWIMVAGVLLGGVAGFRTVYQMATSNEQHHTDHTNQPPR